MFEQVIVNVFPPSESNLIDSLPDKPLDPDQAPDAEHVEALDDDHVRVTNWPMYSSFAEDENVTLTGGNCGSGVEPPPPPPPQLLIINNIVRVYKDLRNI